jgi:hypothetical protein
MRICFQDKPVYNEDTFAGSDDEIDPYKETVRQEAKAKAGSNDDDDRDSSDSGYYTLAYLFISNLFRRQRL